MKKKNKPVYFATGNKGKAREAEQILGVDIEVADIELDEIQSMNAKKVVEHKLMQAFEKLRAPVIVDDVSLEIDVWGRFPGTLVKHLHGKDTKRILYMMRNETNRNATMISTVGYHDGEKMHFFTGKLKIRIADKDYGENGWGLDPILIPLGQDKSFGQMSEEEKNSDSHRTRALLMLKRFINSQKTKERV